MKSKLLLIGILFIGFNCRAQTSVGDSIFKIKNLLQGIWLDSLHPGPENCYTFKDNVISIIWKGGCEDSLSWEYHIDTVSESNYKNLQVLYYCIQMMDRNYPCLRIELLNNKRLFFNGDGMYFYLIKKE